MLIDASITAGIRPMAMIMREQPTAPWDEFDFLCLEAHEIVLRERCGQCGLPRWICHNDDEDIQFKPVEETCFAKKELQQKDENDQKAPGYVAEKGVTLRPEPFTYSKTPFDGVMREAYYRGLHERANPES